MSLPWQSGAATFERMLHRHGVAPGGRDAMDAAWAAFEEFAQLPVEGVAGPEEDGDGFIVEWGFRSWNDHRPTVSLGRQLAVVGADHPDDVQYWRVEFEACFAKDLPWPDPRGQDAGGNTGFDFAPRRRAPRGRARRHARLHRASPAARRDVALGSGHDQGPARTGGLGTDFAVSATG
jgi:hypothetical protein